MAVMAVTSRIAEYAVRVVLIFYGLVDLLGVVWYLDSIYTPDLVQGVAFSFSALFVGLSPFSLFRTNRLMSVYISICVLGIVPSAYMGFQYAMEDYRGWDDVGEQLLLIACFIFMAVRVKMKKDKSSMGSPT